MAFLCYSSSYIKKLTVHQEGGVKELRGQLHLFLRADSGNFKSTILKELSNYCKVSTKELITSAGLIGTIDKNQNVIPGEAWRVRNKLLLLDEFNVEGDSNCIPPLLSMLENQEYGKAIGRMANEQKEKDGDLYFEVKKGELKIRSRFACVICSMKRVEKNRSANIGALLSRCVYFPYELTKEEIKRVVKGHSLMTFKQCPFKKPVEIVIKAGDYDKIMDCVDAYPELNVKKHYARTVGDCCRAFAVLGKHDEQVYFLITKLHQES